MQKLQRKSGQGMTEYIIIIAIIAIGAILIVGLFGRQIKEVFTGMGSSLAGNDNQAGDVSGDLGTESDVKETMGSFDDQDQ
jgi:Flp pilus assembly pilin Flp